MASGHNIFINVLQDDLCTFAHMQSDSGACASEDTAKTTLPKRRGRKKTKNPTCRQVLTLEKWCVFCKKRRRANMCLLRRNNLDAEIPACHTSEKSKQNKRIPRKRDFYATYASAAAVDSALEFQEKVKVQWHLPLHLGGTRRGTRLRNSISTESAIKSMLLSRPLSKLKILRDQEVSDGEAEPEAAEAAEAAEASPAPAKRVTIDNILGRKKKRRLIQLTYEILGCPPENYPNGVSRWEGKAGTISVIREYLGLESGRARTQIRDVLRYVSDQRDAGASDIDAGVSCYVVMLLCLHECTHNRDVMSRYRDVMSRYRDCLCRYRH